MLPFQCTIYAFALKYYEFCVGIVLFINQTNKCATYILKEIYIYTYINNIYNTPWVG